MSNDFFNYKIIENQKQGKDERKGQYFTVLNWIKILILQFIEQRESFCEHFPRVPTQVSAYIYANATRYERHERQHIRKKATIKLCRDALDGHQRQKAKEKTIV